jgi:hypothetical protein
MGLSKHHRLVDSGQRLQRQCHCGRTNVVSSAGEAIVAAPFNDQTTVLDQPSKVARVNRALCKRAAGHHLTVFD